jgi:hypothetical protein
MATKIGWDGVDHEPGLSWAFHVAEIGAHGGPSGETFWYQSGYTFIPGMQG